MAIFGRFSPIPIDTFRAMSLTHRQQGSICYFASLIYLFAVMMIILFSLSQFDEDIADFDAPLPDPFQVTRVHDICTASRK